MGFPIASSPYPCLGIYSPNYVSSDNEVSNTSLQLQRLKKLIKCYGENYYFAYMNNKAYLQSSTTEGFNNVNHMIGFFIGDAISQGFSQCSILINYHMLTKDQVKQLPSQMSKLPELLMSLAFNKKIIIKFYQNQGDYFIAGSEKSKEDQQFTEMIVNEDTGGGCFKIQIIDPGVLAQREFYQCMQGAKQPRVTTSDHSFFEAVHLGPVLYQCMRWKKLFYRDLKQFLRQHKLNHLYQFFLLQDTANNAMQLKKLLTFWNRNKSALMKENKQFMQLLPAIKITERLKESQIYDHALACLLETNIRPVHEQTTSRFFQSRKIPESALSNLDTKDAESDSADAQAGCGIFSGR